MQQAELNVITRQIGHNTSLRTLREGGMVPANIYGPGSQSVVCAFNEKELRKALQNDLEKNLIFNLKSEDKALTGKKVILKSLDRDPTTWNLVHADLYEVVADRPIVVSVPVRFNGIPEGVKNGGGIQQVLRRTIRVKALLADLPEFIDADVTAIGLGDSLHIKDLKFSSKITVLDSGDYTLLAVVEPEKEEVAAVAVAAAGEGTAAAAGTGAAAAAGTGAAAAAGTAAPAAGAAGGDKAAAKAPAKK